LEEGMLKALGFPGIEKSSISLFHTIPVASEIICAPKLNYNALNLFLITFKKTHYKLMVDVTDTAFPSASTILT
jgi:hypothetical protein